METKKKKSFLTDIPSSALAILTLIGAFIVLFAVGTWVSHSSIINEKTDQVITYIIFDVLIAVGCYFIVKRNPRSIWYVPLICNAFGIISNRRSSDATQNKMV